LVPDRPLASRGDQMLAEDHDVLLAFVKPSLESPKALHINASLGFEDGVAVRELPVEIRLASHALLGAALAIGREAPRPRALDEEDADGGQQDHHDQGDARMATHDQLV
jgi:hypothetical protein